MPRFLVTRSGGKTVNVEATRMYLQERCLTFHQSEWHKADQGCGCPEYQRLDDDGEPKAHEADACIVAFADGEWLKAEVVT